MICGLSKSGMDEFSLLSFKLLGFGFPMQDFLVVLRESWRAGGGKKRVP